VFLDRGVSESAARRAIALALIAMRVTVTGVGIIELVRGFTAPGLLPAVAVELLYAALFYRVLPRAVPWTKKLEKLQFLGLHPPL
jgi:hypothetical protein